MKESRRKARKRLVDAARRSVEVAKAGRAKFQRRDVSTEFQSQNSRVPGGSPDRTESRRIRDLLLSSDSFEGSFAVVVDRSAATRHDTARHAAALASVRQWGDRRRRRLFVRRKTAGLARRRGFIGEDGGGLARR